jgi:GNAT superfamily N-acetyltransferase
MPGTVRIRRLLREDIPEAMRLKDEAGWNQTAEDWARLLEMGASGCLAAERDGMLIGTATMVEYGGTLAWIGMVLVDRRFRGEGIGTRLLEAAVSHLDSRGISTMKLDATPQGRPLYERLGFREEYCVERWSLRRKRAPAAETSRPGPGAELAPDLLSWDRQVFGADRGRLLAALAAEAPEFVVTVRDTGGRLRGYSLGRHGSAADHMGPCAAEDEPAARELLDGYLRRTGRQLLFVDEACPNPWIRRLLQERGFEHSRPLTRMYRGDNASPGEPRTMCAILGPEFG